MFTSVVPPGNGSEVNYALPTKTVQIVRLLLFYSRRIDFLALDSAANIQFWFSIADY